MLVKEIEKLYPIKFSGRKKNKEVSQEELEQIIENAYIMQLRYKGLPNIDPRLIEARKKLEYRTKRIKGIKSIYFIENAILRKRLYGKEYNNFLVLEDMNEPRLLFNISTGEDLSFDFDKNLCLFQDITKIDILYDINNNSNDIELDIGYTTSIKLYKNSELKNILTNSSLGISDYIEITDKLDNKIYLDIKNKFVYSKKDIYELYDINNSVDIFIKDESLNIDRIVFNNYSVSKLL